MPFISSSNLDAVNDYKNVKRKLTDKFTGGNGNVKMHGTPSVSMHGNELVNLMERFIYNAIKEIEDPSFDFVQLHIYWADRDGLFAPEFDANGQPNVNSALAYLTRIGETERHDMLQSAMQLLQELFDMPYSEHGNKRGYYLRNVDGLGTINENFRKRGVPYELNFTLSDDVCWRVRSICSSLAAVFYDSQRQLEVLPINLRRFNCCLLVKDVRTLSTYVDTSNARAISDKHAASMLAENPDDKGAIDAYRDAEYQENLTNPFKAADNIPSWCADGVQAMIINLYCCEFHPVLFDDSIDNTDQGDGRVVSLPMTAMRCSCSVLAPAVNFSIPDSEETNKLTEQKKSGFWKRAGQALKAKAAATITSYANVAYNVGKSIAMSMAYDGLEQLGVTKYLNYANQILSGNLAGNMLAAKLDDVLANALAKEALTYNPYFTDKRFAIDPDADKPEDKQYFTDKRLVDNSGNTGDNQPAMSLEQLKANYDNE